MNLLGLVPVIILAGLLGAVTVSADTGEVPSWVKGVAKLWSNDQISDSEFLSALQYLVSNKIIVIPDSDTDSVLPEEDNTEPVPVTIMQSTQPVYDVWIQDREGPEPRKPVSFNHISLLKGWDDLDGEETFDRLKEFYESAREDFRAGDTRQDRIEHLTLFFGSDRDFAPYWYDLNYDEMVRYTDDYVGEKILVEGTVFEVKDQDHGFKITLDGIRLNFGEYLPGGIIAVDYDGQRLRDGDSVMILGEISGLEVLTIRNAEIISELRSDVGDESTSIQVETIVVSAHAIQVVVEPYDILPRDLEKIALEIPYDQYRENREILDGLIVRVQGSLIDEDYRNSLDVDSFRINTASKPSMFHPVTIWTDNNVIDVPDSRIVEVYGLCTYESLSTTDPAMYAIRVSVP